MNSFFALKKQIDQPKVPSRNLDTQGLASIGFLLLALVDHGLPKFGRWPQAPIQYPSSCPSRVVVETTQTRSRKHPAGPQTYYATTSGTSQLGPPAPGIGHQSRDFVVLVPPIDIKKLDGVFQLENKIGMPRAIGVGIDDPNDIHREARDAFKESTFVAPSGAFVSLLDTRPNKLLKGAHVLLC